MSCKVRFKTVVIASKGLLPLPTTMNIFNECLKKLGLVQRRDQLISNSQSLGSLSLGDRIVLSYTVDSPVIEQLRNEYTKLAEVAHKNYLNNLEKQKEALRIQENDLKKLHQELSAVDARINLAQKAMTIQKNDSCEALKLELIDAAREKGYEIVEEKLDAGVRLQFVKVQY